MSAREITVIRNGRVVTPEGEKQADVYFASGRIVGVGSMPEHDQAAHVIDAAGKYVVPGFIDGHVHLREMGNSDREDFYTGTQAAAVGGITTVMDMPNSKPNVITPDDYKSRRDRVLERAYVNIGLYVWACSKNADRLHEFQDLRPVGFKIFTAETGAYDPEFAKYITTDAAVMYRIFEQTARLRTVTAVHSECQSLIGHFEQHARNAMQPDMRAYLHSRRQSVEDVAVFSEVAMARETGARLHICHVVGKGAVDFLRWAKRDYYPDVTCEAAPGNLLMNDEDTIAKGSVAKFSPPVQGETHRRALWAGLLDGTIDIVGSDHAPQDYEKKHNPNIWEASPGSPALDYWVPVMLDRVARGEISMQRFVAAASSRPAQIFGLYPRKGAIAVGADADLVVLDMEKTAVVSPANFKSKARYTPFEGWTMRGLPAMTFVGGTLVARDGEIVGKPGTGTIVTSGH
ncbi:MAG TPA: dihydroorotase family protein [Burkholderiales bacterium]|nr:dihydroorotase family protein [Burkholderiales bacterium]